MVSLFVTPVGPEVQQIIVVHITFFILFSTLWYLFIFPVPLLNHSFTTLMPVLVAQNNNLCGLYDFIRWSYFRIPTSCYLMQGLSKTQTLTLQLWIRFPGLYCTPQDLTTTQTTVYIFLKTKSESSSTAVPFRIFPSIQV